MAAERPEQARMVYRGSAPSMDKEPDRYPIGLSDDDARAPAPLAVDFDARPTLEVVRTLLESGQLEEFLRLRRAAGLPNHFYITEESLRTSASVDPNCSR